MKPYLIKVYVVGGFYHYTGLFASTCAAAKDAFERFHDYAGDYRIFARPA